MNPLAKDGAAFSPPTTITSDQYTEYASKWEAVATGGGGLDACFRLPTATIENLLEAVTFPMSALTELVSAIGVAHIKAKFLVIEDEGARHFTVALVASNAQHQNLTAYYLADKYWLSSISTPVFVELPLALARHWHAQWMGTAAITPALFTVPVADSTELLRGYTFDIDDFVQMLRHVETIGDQVLQCALGLHTYTDPTGTPAAKLGLMLSLESEEELVFDMSSPCPPTC